MESTAHTPSDEAKTPIHLILGSGGARGLAHIGVVKVLHEQGYDITSITGCSMGALVGALIVTGHMEAYEEWVCKLTRRDVIRFLDISLLGRAGMVKGDKLMEQMSDWLGGVEMDSLPIPLTVVAADIVARKEVWITHGDLLEAVRASIAVPGVFTPLMVHGRVLVDGGILNPLPIPPTRIDNRALTLAVSVSGREVTDPLGKLAPEAIKARGAEAAKPSKTPPAAPDSPSRKPDADVPAGVLDSNGGLGADVENPRIEGFLDSLQRFFGRERNGNPETVAEHARVKAVKKKAAKAEEKPAARPALTDVMLGMFATMQDIIARHQIASSPPDILIDIPRNVCQSHEFYRAREVIDAGEYWARRALEEQRDQDVRSRGGAAARAWRLS